ncbi:MAG: SH3 domain-containing protein [Synergistaceae bacterium]|nr:SH3 domain-containing protein [Synergistaceae bacterium]
MSWIILALTLGASITSIIHGVFMLFGSLSVSGGAVLGIPSTLLASLPVISAMFALTGGIIAFNQNKWGALFLFIAMGLCVPARDTWLYGGLYFFAGLFCFFLKPRQTEQDMYYNYDDEDSQNYPDDADFYYDPDIPAPSPEELQADPLREGIIPEDFASRLAHDDDPLGENVSADEVLRLSADLPKMRRRMSKSCPECGAIVSRENRFCPTCGAKLSVLPDPDNFTLSGRDDDIDIEKLNEQLLTPRSGGEEIQEQLPDDDAALINTDMNDGDDMTGTQNEPGYRTHVKPNRNSDPEEAPRRTAKRPLTASGDDAASTYAEFSRYASKGKKRGRSAWKRAASMLVLVSAVGGALYFLLGLRKLPPGELPPIARTDVIKEADPLPVVQPEPETPSAIAEPVGIAVAENVLPNFTPEREPKSGIITGSSVNVRSDHSTSSSRVTRLKTNTRVEILGSYNVTSGQYAGTWYNIQTGGNEGWVYGKYVRPIGAGLPSGYSNALLKSFGSSKSQLVEALGNPTRSTGSSAEWPGLTATLKGEDITRIRLTASNRELQNGLKTGMSQTTLLQIMGYPSSTNGRTINYNEGGKTGLSIQLDKNNAITTITVNEI